MSGWSFAIRSLWRDLRTGELSVLLTAIVIAVTAMTAVGFFTDRVGRAIKLQASAVLAGDVVIRAPAPIDPSFIDEARGLGFDATESLSFLTMVLPANRTNEGSSLTKITAVSSDYPLRGELLVADVMFGASEVADGIPVTGTGWAEPGLLGRLNIKVGDTVRLGAAELTITRVLEYQPGQMTGGMAGMAPGLLVNRADVPSFNVIRPGSRATYREFFAGPEPDITTFRESLEARVDTGVRVTGVDEAGEQINAAIDRAQRFLTLSSLVTVILAAVATAMAARRYALRHLDTIALLKSMGATQSFVQNSTLAQLLLVIVGTASIGSLLGFVAQQGLVALAPDVLNIELPKTSPRAGVLGLLTAATITIGFALPHLLMLKNIAPIRVLRRDMPPPQLSTGLTYSVAIATLLVMIYAIVRDLKLVLYISAGVALVAAVSFVAGWVLVRSLTRFRGAAGIAWRYGLANISRRGTESVVQIVAFALSLNVLLLLTVVRGDLLEGWKAALPEDAPNYFLINIDPEQWSDMQLFFQDELDASPEFLPFLRGKIIRINGTPVDEVEFPGEGGRFFVGQESNFTWQGKLPDTNRVTAGQWWGEDYAGEMQGSLDERIAGRLGVGIGDTLRLNVGGEELDVPITSLRSIEWDSMRPNFYLMLSPGEVEQLPQTVIAAVFVPPDRRLVLNQFVRKFPGVTVFDLEVIMGQVRRVIERASLSVQYVFFFTLLAGIIVLLAAIQATRDERRFESALLHTLGAQRSKILQGIAVEFATLGCLAGGLAAFGAMAAGWVMAEKVFELDYSLNPYLWLIGLGLGGLIVGVTGTWATRKAVTEPPVAVLREA